MSIKQREDDIIGKILNKLDFYLGVTMYFSSKIFNECYQLLGTENQGKLNIERTSSLVYFLATNMVQREENVEVVNVHKDSTMRKSFTDAVSSLFVLGRNAEGLEYQANYLGQITIDSNTMAVKTGKNFFSTQVNSASKRTEPVDYPTRPTNSAILKLGIQTDNGRYGIEKHENWQQNINNFLNFRFSKSDTFPLIVFLLRNKDIDISGSIEQSIEDALSENFTENVVQFLMENAEIITNGDSFSEQMWTIDQLDSRLFRRTETEGEVEATELSEDSYPDINIGLEIPRNRIIYGAPGTGKSFILKKEVEEYFSDENLWERITFHPNYSYSQFVGTYKPVPLYKKTENQLFGSDKVSSLDNKLEPLIDYQFVPGPFLSNLIKAYQNPNTCFVLVIEEINRANAASVFGDAFQLLDRKDTGISEYSITFNPDVMNYIRSQGIMLEKIKLPSNFFIWATMNSADQGVTPMDTAFKRRWSFEYLPLNENESEMDDEHISLSFMNGEEVPWNKFRKVINDHIKNFVSEDKLIGPFFLKKYELNDPKVFKNKLLLYLRDDVLRHNYDKLFLQKNFSDIVQDYDDNKNVFVFSKEILRSSDQ